MWALGTRLIFPSFRHISLCFGINMFMGRVTGQEVEIRGLTELWAHMKWMMVVEEARREKVCKENTLRGDPPQARARAVAETGGLGAFAGFSLLK